MSFCVPKKPIADLQTGVDRPPPFDRYKSAGQDAIQLDHFTPTPKGLSFRWQLSGWQALHTLRQ